MATVNYYYQTSNPAGSRLPYGDPGAGGGAGTEGSPYNSFSGVEALVEDVATDHSADDLVLHFHPACYFQGGTTTFDVWTNVGKSANSWKSVTLKRWQAIVDAQPLYDSLGWKPTIDQTQSVASGSWTQGYISGGSWFAGTGDVYRATISAITSNSPSNIRWVGGHVTGDNPGSWTIAGTFCSALSYVDTEGDYAIDAVNDYLFVKTGSVGTDPTTRWGTFHYVVPGASLQIVNSERITFENFQVSGTYFYFYTSADGQNVNNISLLSCNGRMCSSAGWARFANDPGTQTATTWNDFTITNPDAEAIESTREDKGTLSTERGTENGINFDCCGLQRVLITNPKITGFSHAGIQVFQHEDEPNDDLYPSDVLIYVNDTSNGKGVITGGVNYQRGLNLRISRNGQVRGLRIAKQTVQSQTGGNIIWQSVFFDETCTAYSDPNGSSAYNVGLNVYSFNSNNGHVYSGTTVKFRGCKHNLSGGSMYAYAWGSGVTAGLFDIRGAVIKDAGSNRYWPAADGTEYTYIRRKAPILAQTQAYLTSSTKQSVKDSFFILDASCVGIATWHPSGGTSDDVTTDITESTWPAVVYNDTVQWGSSFVSGNQQVTGTSGLDFDEDLNYTGDRKTPVQTSARRTRGYR